MMSAAMRLRPLPTGLAPRAGRFILPRQALRPSVERQALQATIRRTYATEAPRPAASPVSKPPKKKFRFFRGLWRATYISVLLGGAYLAYSIYETRFPQEQVEPDPTKKTLVVLGMAIFCTARCNWN
jgi:NADH:ubiquinone reductase (non-electrogenic)